MNKIDKYRLKFVFGICKFGPYHLSPHHATEFKRGRLGKYSVGKIGRWILRPEGPHQVISYFKGIYVFYVDGDSILKVVYLYPPTTYSTKEEADVARKAEIELRSLCDDIQKANRDLNLLGEHLVEGDPRKALPITREIHKAVTRLHLIFHDSFPENMTPAYDDQLTLTLTVPDTKRGR